jgi:hypothetical protein
LGSPLVAKQATKVGLGATLDPLTPQVERHAFRADATAAPLLLPQRLTGVLVEGGPLPVEGRYGDGLRGRGGRSPSSRAARRLSLLRRRFSCLVSHARSASPIAFAFNADSLAPMISLKRRISRSRFCLSNIPALPTTIRDPTLEPRVTIRSASPLHQGPPRGPPRSP